MAFNLQGLAKVPASGNVGKSIDSVTNLVVRGENASFALWNYYTATDTVAQCAAANYFGAAADSFAPGDIINVVATDGIVQFRVNTVNIATKTITLLAINVFVSSDKTFSAAQILALNAAPQTLVAAIPGFVIVPAQFDITLNYKSIAYANAANGTLSLRVGAVQIVDLTANQTVAVFNGAVAKNTPMFPTTNAGAEAYPAQILPNTALTLGMGVANLQNGNSTVTVRTLYRILSCPAA